MGDAVLVFGGARSGKSSYAQSLVEAQALRAGKLPGIVATAQALDGEMAARIAKHQADRHGQWVCAEKPIEIAPALADMSRQCGAILVDCLTLWLSNLMHEKHDLEIATTKLIDALGACDCPIVLVSNEVGMGLVPETPLGRLFRDAQGRLNQDMAKACTQVTFVAAGLPLHLKGGPQR